MKDLTITAIIKVYQYDELNEADQSLMKTAMEASPFTSVAASPAMIATSSSAIWTSPMPPKSCILYVILFSAI